MLPLIELAGPAIVCKQTNGDGGDFLVIYIFLLLIIVLYI